MDWPRDEAYCYTTTVVPQPILVLAVPLGFALRPTLPLAALLVLLS